jgi:hypothetical protein
MTAFPSASYLDDGLATTSILAICETGIAAKRS